MGAERSSRTIRTLGAGFRIATDTIRETLARRERAREPIVVIEVKATDDILRTVSKMEHKGYVLDDTEAGRPGSVLLRFRAGR